jgi:hypothetical protein
VISKKQLIGHFWQLHVFDWILRSSMLFNVVKHPTAFSYTAYYFDILLAMKYLKRHQLFFSLYFGKMRVISSGFRLFAMDFSVFHPT